TIIFVPLLAAILSRTFPTRRLSFAIVVAAVGIWLMTGAAPAGFGRGEFLGLACSIIFSIYILAIDRLAPQEDAYRLTAIQFLIVGLFCFGVSAALAGDRLGYVLKGFIENR